ncbi:MAG TPA: D-alanine--D-alanine ligase [Bacillota bacterium]|nr:D-alanine--D-alanine ligase [Bacillota bacterium]
MKILVLAGGISPERDVSLSSGSLIANALLSKGHHVAFADVYEGIDSIDDVEALFYKPESGKKFSYQIQATEPDLDAIIAAHGGRKELIGPNILPLAKAADVVFVALHGAMGENGMLQAVFDCFDITYTGSDYVGSAIAMDKNISKTLMRYEGIPTADWMLFNTATDTMQKVIDAIGFPCVVKPLGCGSSCGISLVHDSNEWEKAITYAKKYESLIMVEKLIPGREFSIGVLEGEALPIIEIVPNEGFYDYENKYQAGKTQEICPAVLTDEETKTAQALAVAAHNALHLGDYARIDFILNQNDHTFYCLEANNLPGMTPVSLLPQEAAATGLSYENLCEKLCLLAINRRKS